MVRVQQVQHLVTVIIIVMDDVATGPPARQQRSKGPGEVKSCPHRLLPPPTGSGRGRSEIQDFGPLARWPLRFQRSKAMELRDQPEGPHVWRGSEVLSAWPGGEGGG